MTDFLFKDTRHFRLGNAGKSMRQFLGRDRDPDTAIFFGFHLAVEMHIVENHAIAIENNKHQFDPSGDIGLDPRGRDLGL